MTNPDRQAASAVFPLLVLAFDQRGWLSNALWGSDPSSQVTVEQAGIMAAIKTLVAEGLLGAARPSEGRLGMLVDAEFGSAALDLGGTRDDIVTCLAIERNNRPILELERDWRAQLERFAPTFAKVLVWHNPGSDQAARRRQRDLLTELSAELERLAQPWILEILQPPTDEQLVKVGGDVARFDLEIRPELLLRTIAEFRDVGVAPDLWKLEGSSDPSVSRETLSAVTQGATRPTSILVLGRNAPDEDVDDWLVSAARAGFAGFAVGRSIWWEAVRGWLDGALDREASAALIAARYDRFVEVFLGAR
jgi:myo-inositol catabolism protein IolC